MSGGKKVVDKIKTRQKAKTNLGNPFSSDKRKEAVEDLKETSDPSNNALTQLLTPEIPQPEEQTVIPIPDDSLRANEARRRRARQSRTGRQSTFLSDRLGG